jgi:hypothetical protein
MNISYTQCCPEGIITKQRVITINEIDELYNFLQIIKYKKTENINININIKQYGYCYNNKTDSIYLIKKIPKIFDKLGKCLIHRLGLHNMQFNHVDIRMSNIENMGNVFTPRVDDFKLGDKTLFCIIGDLIEFNLINLKNAKKTYQLKLYNGGCLLLEGESRYLWVYSTIPTNIKAKLWIITFRNII